MLNRFFALQEKQAEVKVEEIKKGSEVEGENEVMNKSAENGAYPDAQAIILTVLLLVPTSIFSLFVCVLDLLTTAVMFPG